MQTEALHICKRPGACPEIGGTWTSARGELGALLSYVGLGQAPRFLSRASSGGGGRWDSARSALNSRGAWKLKPGMTQFLTELASLFVSEQISSGSAWKGKATEEGKMTEMDSCHLSVCFPHKFVFAFMGCDTAAKSALHPGWLRINVCVDE